MLCSVFPAPFTPLYVYSLFCNTSHVFDPKSYEVLEKRNLIDKGSLSEFRILLRDFLFKDVISFSFAERRSENHSLTNSFHFPKRGRLLFSKSFILCEETDNQQQQKRENNYIDAEIQSRKTC